MTEYNDKPLYECLWKYDFQYISDDVKEKVEKVWRANEGYTKALISYTQEGNQSPPMGLTDYLRIMGCKNYRITLGENDEAITVDLIINEQRREKFIETIMKMKQAYPKQFIDFAINPWDLRHALRQTDQFSQAVNFPPICDIQEIPIYAPCNITVAGWYETILRGYHARLSKTELNLTLADEIRMVAMKLEASSARFGDNKLWARSLVLFQKPNESYGEPPANWRASKGFLEMELERLPEGSGIVFCEFYDRIFDRKDTIDDDGYSLVCLKKLLNQPDQVKRVYKKKNGEWQRLDGVGTIKYLFEWKLPQRMYDYNDEQARYFGYTRLYRFEE